MTAAIQTAQLSSISGIGDDARALLRDEMPPREFTQLLIDRRHFPDAVRLLAHALPKRESVWWAWVSARRAAAEPAVPIQTSLAATEKWIAQPTEENRRAAMQAAEVAGLQTAAGGAGLAAFFCGASSAPPRGPPGAPGSYGRGRGGGGGVL